MAQEKNFENKVKDFLESVGIYAIGTSDTEMTKPPIGYYEKRWGGGRYVKSGLPDLHIVAHGKNVDVELKAPKGKPSEIQKQKLKQIHECGSFAILLYPKDFEKFRCFILSKLDFNIYDDIMKDYWKEWEYV